MPASTHPNVPLKYGWSYRESGWGPDMNDNLIMIAVLLRGSVLDRDLDTPPLTPSEGNTYLVAATATGAWSGHDDEIAHYIGGAWRFFDPKPGWRFYVDDEDLFIYFNAAQQWVSE